MKNLTLELTQDEADFIQYIMDEICQYMNFDEEEHKMRHNILRPIREYLKEVEE